MGLGEDVLDETLQVLREAGQVCCECGEPEAAYNGADGRFIADCGCGFCETCAFDTDAVAAHRCPARQREAA